MTKQVPKELIEAVRSLDGEALYNFLYIEASANEGRTHGVPSMLHALAYAIAAERETRPKQLNGWRQSRDSCDGCACIEPLGEGVTCDNRMCAGFSCWEESVSFPNSTAKDRLRADAASDARHENEGYHPGPC